MRLRLELLFASSFALACSSDPASSTTTTHPALTVLQACNARAAFASSTACTQCTESVILAPCTCSPENPYLGKCNAEASAWATNADCVDAINACLSQCASDCACQDGCYAGHDSCKQAAATRDSCLVDVCSSVCK